jgi:hypothetical protein
VKKEGKESGERGEDMVDGEGKKAAVRISGGEFFRSCGGAGWYLLPRLLTACLPGGIYGWATHQSQLALPRGENE